MKLFTYIIFYFLLCDNLSAQFNTKIDSLKAILPSLSDTLQIDCNNEISNEYILSSNRDSAIVYQSGAFANSKKINYVHGIAESISTEAAILRRFEDDFPAQGRLAAQSLAWFAKTGNKENIEIAYTQLAFSFFAQSNYQQAIFNEEKALNYYKKKKRTQEIAETFAILANINIEQGEYDKAFVLAQQALDMAKSINSKIATGNAFYVISRIYSLVDDYTNALEYIKLSLQDSPDKNATENQNEFQIWPRMMLAEIYWHLAKYDSAKNIYNSFDTVKENKKNLRFLFVSEGEFFLQTDQYKKAFVNFEKGLALHQKKNDANEIMRVLVDMAKVSLAEKNPNQSLVYAMDGLNMAQKANSKLYAMNSLEVVYKSYNLLDKTDSAYKYLNKFIALKDSVLNNKMKGRIVGYTYESKISYLDDENKFRKLELKSAFRQRLYLSICAIVLILACALIIRNTVLVRRTAKNVLEREKMHNKIINAELQHQKSELEMRVFRAQMNPHFIFNSLNSINRFILQNDSTQASEYLSVFSKLIRMNLQNSLYSLISLESELEALELYLEIESLRFNFHFQYKITIAEDVNKSIIKVPPLILQPFVENAIWHGLMHKDEPGHLTISVDEVEGYLLCIIRDDGIGRVKSAMLKSKLSTRYKSLGVSISSDRINMLKKVMANAIPITLNDIVHTDGSAAGTEVIIKIPVLYDESDIN